MSEKKVIAAYLIATHGPKTVTLHHPAVKQQVRNLYDFAREKEEDISLYWMIDHSRRVTGLDSLPKLKILLEAGKMPVMDDLSRLFRVCPDVAARQKMQRELEPYALKLVGLRQGAALGQLSNSKMVIMLSGQLDPRYRYNASSKATRNVQDGSAQTAAAHTASVQTRRQAADDKAQSLLSIRETLQKQSDRVTNKMIADCANEQGLRTTRGGFWRPDTVARQLKRLCVDRISEDER